MKIATFNVNGVNRRLANLLAWLAEAEPDAVCLQELKATDGQFPRAAVEETLRALRGAGHLGVYPPLVEAQQRKVAQEEHTLYLGPDGVEVLTR